MTRDPIATMPLVILVAYHNTDDLVECLGALGEGFDVAVVDNGGDPRVGAVTMSSGARYLPSGRNLGFAAAVNRALPLRAGKDVLLLNPDARVDAELVEGLVARLHEDPSVAAVAPRLRDAAGDEQQVLWPMPSPREAWLDALGLRRLVGVREGFLIGAVLLLRGAALDEIGELDERFFLYAEECDWQLRARRAGWRVEVIPDLVATHWGGSSSTSSRERERLFHASARRLALKWHGRVGWWSIQLAAVVGALLRLAVSAGSPARRRRYAARLVALARRT
jgi:GT2 family glycosyltransferase